MKSIFYKLFKNIASCYGWSTLGWQILGIVLTFILVRSGFDWWYFNITRNMLLQIFLFPAVFFGFFIPVILPIVLIKIGKKRKNLSILNTSYAIIQSTLLGLGISSFYKVFTGRVGPYAFMRITNSLIDISRQFRFGILRGGAFQGWPSSHTAVAFAVSLTLFTLYPKNKLIRYTSLVCAFYIGIGVSTNIHWFSDFIMGAILGSIIGIIVGKSFLERIDESNNKKILFENYDI